MRVEQLPEGPLDVDDYVFEGFEGDEGIEARLLGNAHRIDYLVLTERPPGRGNEEHRLERWDFTDEALWGFLDKLPTLVRPGPTAQRVLGLDEAKLSALGLDPADLELAADAGDFEDFADFEALGPGPEDRAKSSRDPKQFVVVGLAWMKLLAMQRMRDDPEPALRFRVRAYEPKASGQVRTGSFWCRLKEKPTLDAIHEPVTLPTKGATDEGFQALGHAYRDFAQLMVSVVSRVIGMFGQASTFQGQHSAQLAHQLSRSQAQAERLVQRILDAQLAGTQVSAEHTAAARNDDNQTALLREGLGTLTQIAQVFAASKLGLPAGLAGVLPVLQQSPELMEVLQDPATHRMLANPEMQQEIASALRAAGAAHDGLPPSPPPEPEVIDALTPSPPDVEIGGLASGPHPGPGLLAVLGRLQQNPALVEALQNPAMLAALEDPATVAQLVDMLALHVPADPSDPPSPSPEASDAP